MFINNDFVSHDIWGIGKVEKIKGNGLVIVHFISQNVYKACLLDELTKIKYILEDFETYKYDKTNVLEFVTRFQSEAIQSINNEWGVFTISKIDLLPHQLWVGKKVTEQIPFKWLVADDVGLGKTIEAGLILLPLIQRNLLKRILIITPASIVTQWHQRMYEMFDIRVSKFNSEDNKSSINFWAFNNFIIASLQTMRLDNNDLINDVIESKSFDLIIVDEAHHLNNDEHGGETLGFQLIRRINEANKIKSLLFFTGTPHRGKNFGFISLLSLLSPELFNPRKEATSQYQNLKKVMIRNNKQCVTDFNGNKLFKPPIVNDIEYYYNDYEKELYRDIKEFILSGRAYANSQQYAKTINLVLTTFEKLLSSSFSAIKKAFKNRLNVLQNSESNSKGIWSKYDIFESNNDFDNISNIEEENLTNDFVRLKDDEEEAIQEILDKFKDNFLETKFEKIIDLVKNKLKDKTILFFTEYKSTQSMLVSLLMKEFGENSVTFINGDNCLPELLYPGGSKRQFKMKRELAEKEFNTGIKKYLVSTEAAGEGKDLQKNCHTLIHVDMHWNPMRMHQRVGRINRYGQKKQVEVFYVLNYENADKKIRNFMDEKIENVMLAFNEVMTDREDLKQIILGTASNSSIDKIAIKLKNNEDISRDNNDLFGNEDLFEYIKNVYGNVEKFDFSTYSKLIPNQNLNDLKHFLLNFCELHNIPKKSDENSEYIEIKIPKKFKEPGIKDIYKFLFNRMDSEDNEFDIIGIGNKFFNKMLNDAVKITSNICILYENEPKSFIGIYKVYETLSRDDITYTSKIIYVEKLIDNNSIFVYRDSDLLELLNRLSIPKINDSRKIIDENQVFCYFEECNLELTKYLDANKDLFVFNKPSFEILGIIIR
jgi:ERCC4-related helicase